MTNLYRYLPTLIKLKDKLASNIDDRSTDEGILEKLVTMISTMFDETDDFIKEILDIQDPDHCDPSYFSHISYILGTMLPTQGTEAQIRFILKNLISHYKTKGTHNSWRTGWLWQGQDPPKVTELWKSTPREVGDYSEAPDSGHALKSARIQLGACVSYCEASCEVSCEYGCEDLVEFGQPLSTQEALAKLAYVDYLRPIHVLLHREAQEVQASSPFPGTQESISHYPAPAYGVTPDPWLGSETFWDSQDRHHTTGEELSVDSQCVSTCELACQGCCEAQCECDPCEVSCQSGGCELSCTDSCEAFCEHACEGTCEGQCAAACQGPCTSLCAGACLSTCEGTCASSCQASCTTTGCMINSCASTCQASCTTNGCMMTSCASTCQCACVTGTCAFSCESNCQASLYCTVHSAQ